MPVSGCPICNRHRLIRRMVRGIEAMESSTTSQQPNLDSTLRENRVFPPPAEFAAQAHVKSLEEYDALYRRSIQDPQKFWGEVAAELHWFAPWTSVLEWKLPLAKWFVGGKINLCYNCVDRHALSGRKDKVAILWEGEPGETRKLTYGELHLEVQKVANVLKGLGIRKGDRVAVYMGMTPELAIALLACARIGAIHSVIFGGFAANALVDRINDASCVALLTQDGSYRRGQEVRLKAIVDEALVNCPTVKNVVVYRRTGSPVTMKEGRDQWWQELVDKAPAECPAEPLDSEDPLYILYTSGTTGKPKGLVHTTGGYSVQTYLTSKLIFDLKPDDVYWCTADVGWVTGHSYVVYGILQNGVTTLMYEGAPNYPESDRLWKIVDDHKVTVFYTAPTAIRACIKWGDQYPLRRSLASLRLLGTVGEPINPEAWIWYREIIGKGRCPIVDTWWQTETGAIMLAPRPGGVPSMARTIFNDPDRYAKTYWSEIPGCYFSGDGARVDQDGDYWLMGRVDDVINVSGHRLGTMEVESALVAHPKVAEAAVVGRPHELKGQALAAFVALESSHHPSPQLKEELREWVAKEIGSLARPDDIRFTQALPQTRSGKLMRRLLRELATSGDIKGDPTTLEDFTVIAQLRVSEE